MSPTVSYTAAVGAPLADVAAALGAPALDGTEFIFNGVSCYIEVATEIYQVKGARTIVDIYGSESVAEEILRHLHSYAPSWRLLVEPPDASSLDVYIAPQIHA